MSQTPPNTPPLPASSFAAQLPADKIVGIAIEAYKKHAAELLAIEDAQQKMTLLLLGVFAAGASYISTSGISISGDARIGLTVIAAILVLVGLVYTLFRNRARRGTRKLLVSCEHALGMYQQGIYLQNASLNPPSFASFPNQGDWLGWMSWGAILAAAVAFILLLLTR